jgi:hypothetical protein
MRGREGGRVAHRAAPPSLFVHRHRAHRLCIVMLQSSARTTGMRRSRAGWRQRGLGASQPAAVVNHLDDRLAYNMDGLSSASGRVWA